PEEREDKKQADAGEAAEQVCGITRNPRHSTHELACQMAKRDEHDRIEREHRDQKRISFDSADPRPAIREASHDKLLGNGIDAASAKIRAGKNSKEKGLQRKERQNIAEPHHSVFRQAESDAKTKKAREQADVLENGEGVEARRVPAHHDHFEV